MDATQQSQDAPQQDQQPMLLPLATPTFIAPQDQEPQQPAQQPAQQSQQPQDANWDAFVAQHANPANQNDSGWDNFVAQNADKATPPSETEVQAKIGGDIVSGVAAAAHVANAAIEGIGGSINSTVADILNPHFDKIADMLDFPAQMANAAKSSPYQENVSQGLQDFRNSKGFIEGASKFGDLINQILAPSAKTFLDSAIGQQTGAVVQSVGELFEQPPKDEYGNAQAWSPEEAIDRFMSAMVTPLALQSIVPAGMAQQIAQPIGEKLFPNNPQAQQDFSVGVGQGIINITMAMEGLPVIKPPAIERAERTNVLTSDDAYFNEPLKPEPTAAQSVAATEEIIADAPIEKPVEPITPETPKTINDIVRENNPTLFKAYDEITDKQDRLRGWINDLSSKRDNEGAASETQSQIDTILSKVKGVEDRLTKKAAARLEDLRDQLDDIRSQDTPDMALVRQQLQKLDEQKRDMAEAVSAEYRKAQDQMPKKEAEPVAPPIEVAANEAKPETEAQPQELKLGSGEQAGSLDIGAQLKANEPPKAEVPKIDIADDVSKKLIAAGRSPEEAQANGAITAQIYKYFADAYGGAKGTAEEWYQREGAIIAKHGEKVKRLAQNSKKLNQDNRELITKHDLWKLPRESLEQMRDEENVSDHDKLVKALGSEDAAKNFKRLLRQSESMDYVLADKASKELGEIEDGFTPEQQRLVYGIGETGATAEDFDELVKAHSDITFTAHESNADVGYIGTLGIRKLLPKEILSVKEGKASIAAQAALIRFKGAFDELRDRGLTTEESFNAMAHGMSRKSGMSIGDATDFVRDFSNEVINQTKKIAQNNGGLAQGVKGRYYTGTAVSKAIIRLMKRADASTFMHESAHHYLDMMSRFAQEDGAPEKLKADFAEIRNWLGKDTGEFSGFTERQHEAFARAFERYLHEGVAPTKEMAGVFAKFKQWMLGIYKTAKDIPNQKIEINDNIRNVFDRMLGGKGDRETVIAPELPLKSNLKDNIKSPDLKKLFGSVPAAPKSLTEWLAEKGGLKDDTGDLKAMDADKAHIDPKTGKAKPYAKKLVKDDGMSLDDAARAAHEAGYFPEKGGERPTTAELLSKIREDLHGNKQYSDKDHEELTNYEEALKYNAQVDQIAHETGIDPTGKTHDEFWDAVAEHYNAEKRYNEAQDMAENARSDYEKYEREQEEHSANSGETASESEHATLEDLENDRKQEIAAHDAAGGTANAERPQRSAGVEGLGEAGVRQGGSGVEPSGRDGQATTASGSTSTGADGGSAGEAGGDAASRADANSAGYTAGERTNGTGARPAGAEPYYVDKGGRFRLDKFNTSHDAMAAMLERLAQNNNFLDARTSTDAYKQSKLIDANKEMIAQLSEELAKLINKDERTPQDHLDYTRMTQQLDILMGLRAELQADWAHAGHALRRVVSTENVPDPAALAQRITGKTLYQLDEEAKMMGQIKDPLAQAQFAQDMRGGKWRRFEDGTLAYFRNAILSNPKTHAAYLVGNYVWAMTRAIATKGTAALLSGGKNVPFGEVKQAVYGIHVGAMNALPIAAAALRSGVPFMRGQVGVLVQNALGDIFKSLPEKGFDFGLQEENLLNAARKEAVESGVKATDINPALALTNADKGAALAQKTAYPAIHAYLEDAAAGGAQHYRQSLPGAVGRALTVPERSMAAIHTISYAMNFEMEIASEAYRNAVNKGLDGDAMNIAIAKFTQNPPVEVMNAAHEQSLRAVFMNKPTFGGAQWIAARFVHNDIPGVRLITNLAVPFAQIGMNILEQGFVEHTPLGFLNGRIRDDLYGKLDPKTGIRAPVDPVLRDMAHAKMIVGSSAATAIIALNQTGFTTGGGPSDPHKRTVLEATGWKPYSVKVGDLYIPYKRWLGPMGPLMGAASDLGEAGHMMLDGDRKNAAIAIAAGFGENIADETWMNGLSNLVQTSRSEASAWKFIEQTATGFVPYSAALNEVAKQTDPDARLTRSDGASNLWGLLPKVQARIPGLSYMLPAKVDVFGEPIPSSTSIGVSLNRDDPVVQKLAELGVGISQIQNKIRGVQLTNEQYNDYAVTAGVLVKENLTWLVQDPEFGKMTHTEQIKEISAQVKEARHAAQQDMLYRYPEIQDKANDIKESAESGQ